MKNILTIVIICRLTQFGFSQNFGIDQPSPLVKLHVNGNAFFDLPSGGAALENSFTIKKNGQGQINFGSYPGAWTPALQIQNNDNTKYVWLSPLSASGNARLVSMGSDFDIMPGNTLAATFYTNGSTRFNGDIFADHNYGEGLVGVYASTRYQNVFSMGYQYRLSADGTSPGNLYGLAWTHSNVGGQSISGLGHQLLAMSNGVTTAAMGNGFWTAYVTRSDQGFNVDGNTVIDDDAGWHRTYGNTGWYNGTYAGGWHMTDGTWIRSYNSRNVYVDAQLRADGGLVSGGIGSSGGGYIDASRNIRTVGGSQGTLELTSDLPGYAINTYPTLKTSGSYMYFSVGGAYSDYVTTGGSIYAQSSRTKKENFETLNKQDILKKISELEMYKWNYKIEKDNVKHIGPIAEDFYEKFKLGENNWSVSHLDPAGVALVGVQALSEQVEAIKTSSDFGSLAVTATETLVKFNENFTKDIEVNSLPVVTLTSNKPDVNMYVSEKNAKGFKIKISSVLPAGLVVDYIAMVHKKEPIRKTKVEYSAEAQSAGTHSQGPADPKMASETVEMPKVVKPLPVDLPADFKRPEDTGKVVAVDTKVPPADQKIPVVTPLKERGAAPKN